MKFRNAKNGLLMSLLVPLAIYISAPIIGAIIGNSSAVGFDSAILLFILANFMVLPAIILLRKFWQLNSGISVRVLWLQQQLVIVKQDGSIQNTEFSEIDRAVLLSTLSWTRKFWRGDGLLLWEPMHFATLYFKDGTKLTITTLLVTDIPEMLKRMGVPTIEHITKFYPYPTQRTT